MPLCGLPQPTDTVRAKPSVHSVVGVGAGVAAAGAGAPGDRPATGAPNKLAVTAAMTNPTTTRNLVAEDRIARAPSFLAASGVLPRRGKGTGQVLPYHAGTPVFWTSRDGMC